MTDEQLNSLAVKAANGCRESSEAIMKYFIPIVQRMSSQIWYMLLDESSFEQECYRKIARAATKYDPTRGRTFRNYIYYKIHGIRSTHLKRRSKSRTNLTSIEALASRDDEGNDKPYEVLDNLAVVDDALLVNEKIALLAEDDSRKLAILNAWSNGEYNDSDTASFLAKRYGGNSESHRKFINRFRTTCQKALA
jgi:hypothetical protein